MRIAVRNRFVACATHLSLSGTIAALVFLLIYAVWYPLGLFAIAGGRDLFVLIAAVDVSLGPLLTLVVFKPGKKGLAFDLSVIALMQVVALAYGIHVLYEARPAFIVFVKDRFELVRAIDVSREELAKARGPYGQLSASGPQIVGTQMPTDREERERLIFGAASGVDLHQFPKFFIPYDRVRGEVRSHGLPIADLRKLNLAVPGAVDAVIREVARPENELRFLPVRAGKVDFTAIVDARDGDLLRVVALRPWEFK